MMRGCLVVGCADYTDTSLSRLPGAQADAEKMHAVLCSPAIGNCDPLHSHKLISPTRSQLENALRKLLAGSDFDVFTFYFAGHGEVRNGTFTMLLQDSRTAGREARRSAHSQSQLGQHHSDGQVDAELDGIDCSV